MPYRAHLVFDFTDKDDNNAYQRMQSALVSLEWKYVETSAFMFEQPEGMEDDVALRRIWQGIAIFARALAAIGGALSALTYTIQLVDTTKAAQSEFGGATNPQLSYTDISTRVFPGDALSGN